MFANPSKSYTQRVLAAACIAARSDGVSVINGSSRSDDAKAAVEIIKKLGAVVEDAPGDHGKSLRISAGNFTLPGKIELNCGESALNLRLFKAMAGTINSDVTMSGRGTLLKRVALPYKVERLKAGVFEVDGSKTSQDLSGLLMALPCVEGDSEIVVRNLKSRPYVEMTLKVLKDFGIEIRNEDFKKFKIKGSQKYKGTEFTVEGDWSGAAFILVAGAICGNVRVDNLNINSLQGDKVIVDVLKQCGAGVMVGKSTVEITKDSLRPFNFDVSECPDLLPPLVALALNCDGSSIITGIERLKYKESDRVQTLFNEFSKMGAVMKTFDDRMIIQGGRLKGCDVESHNDHRVVMALAVAGLNSLGRANIKGAECVSKSYPDFFSDLKEVKRQ